MEKFGGLCQNKVLCLFDISVLAPKRHLAPYRKNLPFLSFFYAEVKSILFYVLESFILPT